MMDVQMEEQIVRQMRAGDEAGLTALMDHYTAYVSAVVCGLAHGMLTAQDAEELASDVFAAVWNAADRLHPPLRPYLARAARNAAVSRLRRMKREPIPLGDDLVDFPAPDGPDEIAVRSEQRGVVAAAVGELGEPDREIFVRFYFFGEQVRAIAARLGLGTSAVKTKLHRCRKKIRAALEGRGYQHETRQAGEALCQDQ